MPPGPANPSIITTELSAISETADGPLLYIFDTVPCWWFSIKGSP